MDRAVRSCLKHAVLDCMHAPPGRVEVCLGKPGSLENSILARVVEYVIMPIKIQTGEECTVRVDDDIAITGCLSACRYIGRLFRIYPTDPCHAIGIDANLDLLCTVVAAKGGRARSLALEAALDVLERVPYEYDSITVSDLCWAGAIEWFGDSTLFAHPRMQRWWAGVYSQTR